ncbi:MAG: diphthine--ammonia ligase [Acidobacteriaceae bacterium]
MKNVIVSWSGGKDSCFACFKAMQSGYKVCFLLNTISDEYKRVRFHGVKAELIQAQAAALGIPLLHVPTSWNNYKPEFISAVKSLVEKGCQAMVFGDLFLFMREFGDEVCKTAGIESIEPLIEVPSEEVVKGFIDAGFEAIVVATQADKLGQEWLGRKIDHKFLEDIKQLKDIDPCGENGEYHTLVINGPIFKQRINIIETEKVLRERYWFLDIKNYKLV